MAQRKCLCGIYMLDPEDASLVLNGLPACNISCMRRAEARDPRAARDVPVGQPWTFAHKTMGEVIRIEEGEDGRFRIAQ